MWRSKALGGMIPKPSSMVNEPQKVGSDPVKERQDSSVHGVNTSFLYKIYAQEKTAKEWAIKRPLNKCYAPYLPELRRYVNMDGAIELPVNGLIYLPIIPRAYDPAWGQWHIPWYLHKKWVIRELTLKFENN
jgi:hypothetical protein